MAHLKTVRYDALFIRARFAPMEHDSRLFVRLLRVEATINAGVLQAAQANDLVVPLQARQEIISDCMILKAVFCDLNLCFAPLLGACLTGSSKNRRMLAFQMW